MSRPANDQTQRDEALDPTRSFIVQAPAGSGKTELLTLRYMRLLALCSEPEEVSISMIDLLSERLASINVSL